MQLTPPVSFSGRVTFEGGSQLSKAWANLRLSPVSSVMGGPICLDCSTWVVQGLLDALIMAGGADATGSMACRGMLVFSGPIDNPCPSILDGSTSAWESSGLAGQIASVLGTCLACMCVLRTVRMRSMYNWNGFALYTDGCDWATAWNMRENGSTGMFQAK